MAMRAQLFPSRSRCLGPVIALAVAAAFTASARAAAPQTYVWESEHLAAVRTEVQAATGAYRDTLQRLKNNADAALERGPYSVMQKQETPPSGDKHDYLSYARYWWPNPATKDGLPYVRRDGRTNEELLRRGDRETIGMLYDDVESLAMAGYMFDEARYADHAAALIRTWFLDPATRMNPHMRYGQAVPGLNTGRGSGIIDTRHFIRVIDAVALLRASGSWSAEDDEKLQAWMANYLDFLLHDPLAAEERNGHNNHATWYDAQATALALYVGQPDVARRIVESARSRRIAQGIEPDGSQPAEIARTKGLHYCVFNLSALSVLARLAEHIDVDLWRYQTPDGRSLRRGLDFVMPYLMDKEPWPHEQIDRVAISPSDLGLFYRAARIYREPAYLAGLAKAGGAKHHAVYADLQFSRSDSAAQERPGASD